MARKKTDAERLAAAAARSAGGAYGSAVNKLARTRTPAEIRAAERKRVDAHFKKMYARDARSAAAKASSPEKRVSPEKTRLGKAVMSTAPAGAKSGLQSLKDVLGSQKKKKKKR